MSGAQPGWYVDPGDGNQWRWWDGSAWTDATHGHANASPTVATEDLLPNVSPPQVTVFNRVSVHVIGACAYVVALGFCFVGMLISMIITAYSGDTPSMGDRISVKVSCLIVALIASSVPAIIGVIARSLRTVSLPWFILAGVTALYTVNIALSASPVKAPTIY